MANEFVVRKGLIVKGSGSSTVLDVQGSQGQLFSITDSLSGSIFSANDISGIPVIEAFSDNTVKLGTFGAEGIIVSGSFAFITGSLLGTASYASQALSSSYAQTASFVLNAISSSYAQTASFASTASYVNPLNQNVLITGSVSFGKTVYADASNEDFYRIKFQDVGGINNDVGIGQPATAALGINVGPAGYISFNQGTNGERARIASNGNVGINVESPNARLHISGSSNSGLLEIDSPAQNNIIYASGSGNVGFGTATPSARVHIATPSTTGTTSMLLLSRASGYGHTLFEQTYDSNYFSSGKTLTLKNDSGIAFVHFAGNNTGTQTNMLIPSGNVGIGVPNPSYKIHVSGSSNIDSVVLQNNTIFATSARITNYYDNVSTGNSAIIMGGNSKFINFQTDATTRMFISSSGNVGFGTSTPTEKMHVIGNGLFTGDLTVQGKITAEEFHTEFVSASIIYKSGSTKFGDTSDDTHQFTGSLQAPSITGSLFGTSSYATTASYTFTAESSSYAATASYVNTLNQDVKIVGRLIVSASSSPSIDARFGNYPIIANEGNNAGFSINSYGTVLRQNYLQLYGANGAGMSSTVNGNLSIGKYTSDVLTASIYVSSSGNVGIGTNAPNRLMQLSGADRRLLSVYNTGNNSSLIMFQNAQTGVADNNGFAIGIDDLENGWFNNYENTNTIFTTNATERLRITSAGNVLIGNTDGTGRLTVRGSGSTSATTALLVQNSTPTDLFQITDNGFARFRSSLITFAGITTPFTILHRGDITDGVLFGQNSDTTITSGNRNTFSITESFIPTSGTATLNVLRIAPSINQTGGANGITRGLYLNPTLTAAADWRSVEFSNNTGWGLYGAGSANNYLGGSLGIGTANPTARLHISGSSNSGLLEIDSPAQNNIIYASGSGNVGFGTSNPQRRVHIDGSGSSNTDVPLILTSVDSNNRVGILIASSSLSAGRQHKLYHRNHTPVVEWILSANPGESAVFNFLPSDNTNFGMSLSIPRNGGTSYLYTGISQSLFSIGAGGITPQHINISSSGNVGFGTTTPTEKVHIIGNTLIDGTLRATVKSFLIDHPTQPNKQLQYGTLEGPEHSVFVRGKISNTNIITLPDYWYGLIHEDSITVNLTAIGESQNLWVKKITNKYIEIDSDSENINCFYTVYAERKDIDKLIVEFDK